jgi:hypothetical protein
MLGLGYTEWTVFQLFLSLLITSPCPSGTNYGSLEANCCLFLQDRRSHFGCKRRVYVSSEISVVCGHHAVTEVLYVVSDQLWITQKISLSRIYWLDTGFGLVIGFIWLLWTVTTSNYNRLTNLRTLYFTVVRASSSQFVFSSHRLVTTSNIVDSSAFLLDASYLRWLATGWHLTRSQSYFTICGLPPITSSWHKAPWGSRPKIFFKLNPCSRSPYVTSPVTRKWGFLLWICLACCLVYISHI